MTKQSFITAEVAKVGSMDAFLAKYEISDALLEKWVKDDAWFTLAAYNPVNFIVVSDELKNALDCQAREIVRVLNRLNRAYIMAGGND